MSSGLEAELCPGSGYVSGLDAEVCPSPRKRVIGKARNISEECSDIKSNAPNSELTSDDEADYTQIETFDTEDSDEESIINDENESVINMPRKKCRVDKETENTFQETK
ncbi:hypothetical protein TNCV_2758001 [Trichonephila clavipes]|nr:hypothetical protein TNCV_2758001 [Trichonephila clavipes]